MDAMGKENAALAAAAQVANLLAHSINNPLQGLANTVYLARSKADLPELVMAEEQLFRINSLVAYILANGRLSKKS
jgi:nitrogen-specific signal transduction histidine kinase